MYSTSAEMDSDADLLGLGLGLGQTRKETTQSSSATGCALAAENEKKASQQVKEFFSHSWIKLGGLLNDEEQKKHDEAEEDGEEDVYDDGGVESETRAVFMNEVRALRFLRGQCAKGPDMQVAIWRGICQSPRFVELLETLIGYANALSSWQFNEIQVCSHLPLLLIFLLLFSPTHLSTPSLLSCRDA